MFRDAIFQLGKTTIVLPVRNQDIHKIELDYKVKFVQWANEEEPEYRKANKLLVNSTPTDSLLRS